MNITRQSIGTLTEKITLQITKEDYASNVEKTLKEYKRKANIPGFRPGKAPMQMIERMYGKAVLLDELDKLINQHLDQYIQSEQLKILGEPIMAADSPALDIDKAENFEFAFEVGLQPQITIEWPKKDKLTQYEITISDQLVDTEIKLYTKRLASRVDLDKVAEECRVLAEVAEIDETGEVKERGIKVKDFLIDFSNTENEEKKKLIGAEKGSVHQLNLKKITDSEEELLYRLNQDNKTINDIPDNFRVTITSIFQYNDHEINQELFDKIFGEGVVTSEEMFREKVREELHFVYTRESDAANINELKKYLLSSQKTELPTEFLKRWLKSTQKEKNEAKLEEQYPALEEDIKWQLIKNQIVNDYQIEVEEDDILNYASNVVRWQMKNYYGIIGLSVDKLREYGKMLLQKEEDVRRMVFDVLDLKVLDVAKNKVKVDLKKVTPEEFYELVK
ncbi:MAG TPA: trigger factor [Bacteroidales bacterium]|nr:trigger factor [Bacteroidales bacterium]HOK99692.1 trigger factor [Bacteroidales bacterium]HPO64535.1 trigger factor [Bacteroidales bacterium]